jgi:hypothetical protein
MVCGQRNYLLDSAIQESIIADEQRPGSRLN